MNPTTLLTIFVAVAAVAMTVQMIILFALYKAVSGTATKVESLVVKVEERAIPVLDATASILEDVQPKISAIASDLAETSGVIRERVEHLSDATGEVVERARLQAARLDDLIHDTTDRIANTTQFLQSTIFAPVRRIQAILQAVSAGIRFMRRGKPPGRVHKTAMEEDEEMFI